MIINSVESWLVDTALKEPLEKDGAPVLNLSHIILKVETDNGLVGFGSLTPEPSQSGEMTEIYRSHIENILMPLLRGEDPFFIHQLRERMRLTFENQNALIAMAEMALYDLIGKRTGLPLWKLLGGYREAVHTSITIDTTDVDTTLEKARAFTDQGFRILKIVGGRNVDEDIEKLIKIREIVSSRIGLRFDARGRYSVAEAIHFSNAVYQTGLEFIEQPVATAIPEQIGQVTRNVPVPVMVDEGLGTIDDARFFSEKNMVDLFNLKLMRIGGIWPVLRIALIGSGGGKKSMMGSGCELALSVSPALHLSLSLPDILHADLSGYINIEEDPTREVFELRDGLLYPNSNPGLGFRGF